MATVLYSDSWDRKDKIETGEKDRRHFSQHGLNCLLQAATHCEQTDGAYKQSHPTTTIKVEPLSSKSRPQRLCNETSNQVEENSFTGVNPSIVKMEHHHNKGGDQIQIQSAHAKAASVLSEAFGHAPAPHTTQKQKQEQPQVNSPMNTTPPTADSVWDYVLMRGRFPGSSTESPLPKSPEFHRAESFSEKDQLRKGRWTPEEESYAESLIVAFREGKIKLRHSMSLRKFLAESLRCDPMRISKKFPCLKAYKLNSPSSMFNNTNNNTNNNNNNSWSSNDDADMSSASNNSSDDEMIHTKTGTSPCAKTKGSASILTAMSLSGSTPKASARRSPLAAAVCHTDSGDDEMMMMDDHEDNQAAEHNAAILDECVGGSKLVRRGRWTAEEEEYAEAMIRAFKNGQLPLPGSTSLRKFLAEVLRCHPMRVSKKFVGCVRKYHYYQQQAIRSGQPPIVRREVIANLYHLEKRFHESIKLERICDSS